MPYIDLSQLLVGGTNRHRSGQVLSKQCVNFIPQPQQDPESKSPYVLEPFPGLKIFSELFPFVAGGEFVPRGMFVYKDELFTVTGTNFRRVRADGTAEFIDFVEGAGPITHTVEGDSLLMVSGGGRVFEWDGTSITEGVDADLESPNTVASINSRAVYDGDDRNWMVSAAGDYMNIDALDIAVAESTGGALMRVYVFEETIKLFKTDGIETWWNSDEGRPPFDRVQGSIINTGLGAVHSVANTEKFLYFLGCDNVIYAMQGAEIQPISSNNMVREIGKYENIYDAVGWTMNYNGTNFYFLRFELEGVTWAYVEGGEWFNLQTGRGNFEGVFHAYCYRKHLIFHSNGRKIYEMDDEVYTEDGETVFRKVVSAPIHSGLVGQPGKQMEMGSLVIVMETGDGEHPKIMLSISDDGAKTFHRVDNADMGAIGEYQTEIRFDGLGDFYSRIIQLEFTGNAYASIHSMGADLSLKL